jgi:hypothetical protein
MVEKKNNKYKKLENKFKKMFRCDSVRISNPMNKFFLIIGYKKHTKDDTLSYYSDGDGNRIDFEYIDEQIIASGKNIKELIMSAKYYKSLQGMSWEEYFKKELKLPIKYINEVKETIDNIPEIPDLPDFIRREE